MSMAKWFSACVVALTFFQTGLSQAAVISEIGPNHSYSLSHNLDGCFTQDYRDDIDTLWVDNPGGGRTITKTNTSQTIPHVTVEATGDGTVDFYSFLGTSGETVIVDVDYSSGGVDTKLDMWFSGYGSHGGEWVGVNNNIGFDNLSYDTGSSAYYDSLYQVVLPETGLYYIGVAGSGSVVYNWIPTYYTRVNLKNGSAYTMHVSVGSHSYIQPTTDGDLDGDHDVDDLDLNLLLSSFENPPSIQNSVNLDSLLNNFGQTDISGESVPEPSALFLLCMGLYGLPGRNKHKRTLRSSSAQ